MADIKDVQEVSSTSKENARDTNLYSPDVRFYLGEEGRIDLNIVRKSSVQAMDRGLYHSGQNGPVYMVLLRTPLPQEVGGILENADMQNTPIGKAIQKMYNQQPAQLEYRVKIESIDSRIVKFGHSYLNIKFNKKGGVTVQTDLESDQAAFVVNMLDESIGFVLENARSGNEQGKIPPNISQDPLHIAKTDEEFEQIVPKMYYPSDVNKIRERRTQTISELTWLKATIQELKK